ncbi:GDP-L-fucose synthase [Tistlia consotensis]|uniref:GDP-L-fucose synthase n=1 Tax=Tistlia consotensis USBA 355 TaxID=560819 RepID=A0A1Y6CSY7_9PROT|nr:GDP-L-fucose synthase [Tistlia consotensis]SMF71524.1 GDP-L-fucose synthase [Tistlia consotensis USBA 355]SNS06501.1 GDP-L-fucose synthase [Tistlia consotensis]
MATLHYPLAGKRVWVAGHRGLVGSALVRRLAATGCELLTVDRQALDLRDAVAVEDWMAERRPQAVFLAAGRVGGIRANAERPGEFFRDNAAIATNVVHAAHLAGVERLMFLGSSCIYPRLCAQPMAESALLTGPLEPTSGAYAMAKLAGISMCAAYRRQYGRDFVSAVPANLYGPGDNFDPEAGHVVPATIRKVAAAKAAGSAVVVWGSGRPLREFLYVEDAADALVFLMERYSEEAIINVGGGEEVSIAELTALVCEAVGYDAPLAFDDSMPDGMPRKRLDSARLQALGWRPRTTLRDGLAATWRWYREAGHG